MFGTVDIAPTLPLIFKFKTFLFQSNKLLDLIFKLKRGGGVVCTSEQ